MSTSKGPLPSSLLRVLLVLSLLSTPPFLYAVPTPPPSSPSLPHSSLPGPLRPRSRLRFSVPLYVACLPELRTYERHARARAALYGRAASPINTY